MDLKIAVVTFERNMDAAQKLAAHLNGEIVLYEKGIFKDIFSDYNAVVAVFASGIAVREIAPYLGSKWEDPALIIVDSGLNFAIPVLGGHHGGNEVARRIAELGAVPVITTATEVHQKPSVEGIAEKLGCDVRNRKSTIEVNCALLEREVEVLEVKGPKIIVVGEDVSVLVKRKDGTTASLDEIDAVLK
ncbi:MAG: cobalamin biosynthesis protein CbiG [Methanosarcinales archaeon]|jgi:cobalt-precorrin 5A hydrolase|nr:cobalamin biosynthesis protein CbiG [Methanosarcinales archaeon]